MSGTEGLLLSALLGMENVQAGGLERGFSVRAAICSLARPRSPVIPASTYFSSSMEVAALDPQVGKRAKKLVQCLLERLAEARQATSSWVLSCSVTTRRLNSISLVMPMLSRR